VGAISVIDLNRHSPDFPVVENPGSLFWASLQRQSRMKRSKLPIDCIEALKRPAFACIMEHLSYRCLSYPIPRPLHAEAGGARNHRRLATGPEFNTEPSWSFRDLPLAIPGKLFRMSRTDGSNPLSSSGESCELRFRNRSCAPLMRRGEIEGPESPRRPRKAVAAVIVAAALSSPRSSAVRSVARATGWLGFGPLKGTRRLWPGEGECRSPGSWRGSSATRGRTRGKLPPARIRSFELSGDLVEPSLDARLVDAGRAGGPGPFRIGQADHEGKPKPQQFCAFHELGR
jgi:hypothetical protein